MNIQSKNLEMKANYSKPTLIEYGSLSERTKVFGLLNPEELSPTEATASVTSITF